MAAPVDASARMYCTPEDVTTRIDLTQLPKVNLDNLIRAATNRIESYCNRVFTRVPAGATYETRNFLGNGLTMLPVDDLLAIDEITVDGDEVDTDDLLLMPFGKTPTTWLEYEDGSTWPARLDVAISGAWGYSELLPWEIWDACVALCVRALERAKTAYQDASAIPEMGQLIYAKALPADIRDVLDKKRRRNV